MVPYTELAVDAGFASREEAEAAGVRIGTPVTYAPRVHRAGQRPHRRDRHRRPGRLRRAARARRGAPRRQRGPTLHLVWSVQEEHNLRGVLPAATALAPDIAIAVDLMLACDTPEMAVARRPPARRWAGHVAVQLPRARHAQRRHPASGAGAPRGDGGRAARGAAPALGPRGRPDRPQLHPVPGRRGGLRRPGLPGALLPPGDRARGPGRRRGTGALLDAALDGITPELELVRAP